MQAMREWAASLAGSAPTQEAPESKTPKAETPRTKKRPASALAPAVLKKKPAAVRLAEEQTTKSVSELTKKSASKEGQEQGQGQVDSETRDRNKHRLLTKAVEAGRVP